MYIACLSRFVKPKQITIPTEYQCLSYALSTYTFISEKLLMVSSLFSFIFGKNCLITVRGNKTTCCALSLSISLALALFLSRSCRLQCLCIACVSCVCALAVYFCFIIKKDAKRKNRQNTHTNDGLLTETAL